MSLLLNTNATHDLALTSRVESANTPGCDFPIQNLPWGRYRPAGSVVAWKIGVAIGDQILDARAAGVIDTDDMNKLMARSPAERLAPPAGISRPDCKLAADPVASTADATGQRRADPALPVCERKGCARIGLDPSPASPLSTLYSPTSK